MSVSYRRLNRLWFSTRLRCIILCTFSLFLQFLIQLHKSKTKNMLWQWNDIKSKNQSSPYDFICWRPHPQSLLWRCSTGFYFRTSNIVYCIMASTCKQGSIYATGIVHSKMTILLFTHIHFAPNLFDYLSSMEFNRIFKVFFHTMKVKGERALNLQKDKNAL